MEYRFFSSKSRPFVIILEKITLYFSSLFFLHIAGEALYEVPISGCDVSSEFGPSYECERAIDLLPSTEWASNMEIIGAWIKVRNILNDKVVAG